MIAQSKAGHPERGAYGRADRRGEQGERKNVPRPVEGIAAVGEPLHQEGAHQSFQRVARRNSDRGCEGDGRVAGGGQVDQEGAQKNAGPDAIAQQQQCRQGDPGGRPDRGRAGMDGGQLESKRAGDEVNRRQDGDDHRLRKRSSKHHTLGRLRRFRRPGPLALGCFLPLPPRAAERVTVGFIRRNSMMQPCHAGALLQIEPKKSIENFVPTLFLPARPSPMSKREVPPGKLCLHGMAREAKKFLGVRTHSQSPLASQCQFQADSNSSTARATIEIPSADCRWPSF